MNTALHDKRYAILVDTRFEESEFCEPLKTLQALGATVDVVSPQVREIQGVRRDAPGRVDG